MHERRSRQQALWDRLHRLVELPVVPRFSREFYRLIVEWAVRAQSPAPVDWAARLLTIESRYYQNLARLEEGQAPPPSLAEKREIALAVLAESVQAGSGTTDRAEDMARCLILAECCYFLERTGEVVAHLEYALERGGNNPLLSFALGHARFLLALRSFVRWQEPIQGLVVSDQAALRSLCLAAVHAFEGALTGGPQDGEIRWWIGRVLLMAGFAAQGQEILAQLEGAQEDVGGVRHSPAESGEADTLPPIDDAEISSFISAMRRSHPLSRLL